MPWVQIQKAEKTTWDDYQRISQAVGDDVPAGLIYHAAGEQDNGHWQAVSIWESEDDFNRFRDERLLTAVEQAVGAELAQAGPPPTESFDAKHVMRP